ncbi:MAG: hypothetical protein HKN23_15245 [Verrucomicrobiales bacterium]|nr:hypothetical protein [Verrucomicrobiales bacterium]
MKYRLISFLTLSASSLLFLPSCETTNSSSDWRRPSRYGAGGPNDNNNRFGYTDREDSNSRDRDNSSRNEEEEKPKKENNNSSPDTNNLGFAIKVPGKPLSVTLPGAGKSLGEISIEKYDAAGNPTGEPLPPGTPVEIDDPNNPGKKIYFKVP